MSPVTVVSVALAAVIGSSAWADPPAKPKKSPAPAEKPLVPSKKRTPEEMLARARGAGTWNARTVKEAAAANDPDACLGVSVAPGPGTPFLPGEELTYELSVSGVNVGKLELKAGKPRMVDGQRAESFFGRARTSGLAATLKAFEGRYMAVVDPKLYHPLELRSESSYGTDPRNEIAKFVRAGRGVHAQYRMAGKNGERAYSRDRPVYDLLTLMYHARRLPLTTGMSMCQEVYADKRLWRMEAKVLGVESIRTPVGTKDAIKVKTVWERMPHPDFDPKKEAPRIEVDIFYGTDAYRAPLAFQTRTKDFTAKGALVRWATADREQEASWAF